MGKSLSKMSLLYLVGMALVAIGFVMPMFSALGGSLNGFDFINLDNLGTVTIAALLIIIGAIVGIIMTFMGAGNADMIKLIALIASVVGGILIVVTFNDSWLTKMIGKGFWKHASYGTYMILAGWAVAIFSWIRR